MDGERLQLTNDIFNRDALIFEGLNSNIVSVCHKHSNYEVEVEIADFPFLGIWAKPGAPFVCIEPWQGLADLMNHNKRIEDKKGVVQIEKGSELSKAFTMRFTS